MENNIALFVLAGLIVGVAITFIYELVKYKRFKAKKAAEKLQPLLGVVSAPVVAKKATTAPKKASTNTAKKVSTSSAKKSSATPKKASAAPKKTATKKSAK